MNSLPSLRAGLLVHRLDDQALVYDPSADRVHLLDATTARVYEVLATNHPSRSDALAELAIIADGDSTEALLALSIEELRKADLLDRSTVVNRALPDITRRRLLNKITIAGATAMLIPAIATLAASAATTPRRRGGSPLSLLTRVAAASRLTLPPHQAARRAQAFRCAAIVRDSRS